MTPQQMTIGQAVNIIAYLKYVGNRRYLEEIVEVNGFDRATMKYNIKKIA